MKIIGGHDYYDGAGMGVDETILFLRNPEEYTDSPFELPEPAGRSTFSSDLSFHLILVAGKAYPMVSDYISAYELQMVNGGPMPHEGQRHWHYDLDAAMAAHDRFLKVYAERHHIIPRFLSRGLPNTIARHFRETESPAWTGWMLENRVVTGHVYNAYQGIRRKGTFVEANISNLKEFEFFRVMDPATIHMEIANFIGGVLPSSVETIELGNDARIRKAGFDDRSFRKAPGGKKRRRAKA